MTSHWKGKSRYMPGLDGLRALSVLAVIVYHLNLRGATGGFLGVGVFFVLSGYLITDQLAARWHQDRRLDLKAFWIRRARRLLPAMLLSTAAVSVWLAATDLPRLQSLTGDIGSAAAYVNNWWLIYHQVSYFESFGPPSPFGHYWSLAVEEQFYLLWPIVLLILLHVAPRRGKLALWILSGAAVSALLMALLYVPGTDPSRVYYGTDTRVFGLLIGAALAIVWPSRKLGEAMPASKRWALDGIGVASLAAIVWMMMAVKEYDPFVYRGGLLLLSVLTAVVVAVLAHPASRLARLLSVKPLRWVGVRSYSIYLWHYPVIALSAPAMDAAGFHPIRVILQVTAGIALAALSWKWVEEPILRGKWKFGRKDAGAAGRMNGTEPGPDNGGRRPVSAWLTAGLALALCVSCGGAGGAGPYDRAAAETIDASVEPPNRTAASSGAAVEGKLADAHYADGKIVLTGSQKRSSYPPIGTEVSAKDGAARDANVAAPEEAADQEPAAAQDSAPEGEEITVIGDSVILGVRSELERALPGIVVDGKIGRQLSQAHEAVEALSKAGQLGEIVILELGSNGTFSKKSLAYLIDLLGQDRRILLVNTRVPKKWQDGVNDMLQTAESTYDNVTLADWYGLSEGKPEYLGKDGVHPTRTGAKAYAEMLTASVERMRSQT